MGGVAISKGRIYTTGDLDGTAWVFALKEANGEFVRKAKIERGGEIGTIYSPPGPRGTPTIDGDRLLSSVNLVNSSVKRPRTKKSGAQTS